TQVETEPTSRPWQGRQWNLYMQFATHWINAVYGTSELIRAGHEPTRWRCLDRIQVLWCGDRQQSNKQDRQKHQNAPCTQHNQPIKRSVPRSLRPARLYFRPRCDTCDGEGKNQTPVLVTFDTAGIQRTIDLSPLREARFYFDRSRNSAIVVACLL